MCNEQVLNRHGQMQNGSNEWAREPDLVHNGTETSVESIESGLQTASAATAGRSVSSVQCSEMEKCDSRQKGGAASVDWVHDSWPAGSAGLHW